MDGSVSRSEGTTASPVTRRRVPRAVVEPADPDRAVEGLGEELDEYGHVQSADQILALEEGRRAGLLETGDLVCFLRRAPVTPGRRPR